MTFTKENLDSSYAELAPKGEVDLVVIGCPQASIGEVRTTAAAARTWMELGHRIPEQRLWVFTSGHNHGILKGDGTIDILEEEGSNPKGYMSRSHPHTIEHDTITYSQIL